MRPATSGSADAKTDWHARSPEACLNQLASSPAGLSAEEASSRLQRLGPNQLPEPRRPGRLQRFLRQFASPLLYVLLIAAGFSLLLGEMVDAGVIVAVVVANAVLGFLHEDRAEAALASIRELLTRQSTVLRDGQRQTVTTELLVPGDWLVLQAGERLPADVRLINGKGLRVDEAALTGESVPVDKLPATLPAAAPLAERSNMLFAGTLIVAGQGEGLVVETAERTELGAINRLVAATEAVATPLLIQMARFSTLLAFAISLIAALVMLTAWLLLGMPLAHTFMAAVGIAVAAIPEGLPAVLTITLALGVHRMALNRAIIRELPAVETLGSVSVICSDKTGTLTQNRMMVARVATADGTFRIEGDGYAPEGAIYLHEHGQLLTLFDELQEIARAATLCNDANLLHDGKAWLHEGDPTEAALLAFAGRAGLNHPLIDSQFPRKDLIPFDPSYQLMATLHHDHYGHDFIYIKGAPEQILTRCNHALKNGCTEPLDMSYWKARIQEFSAQGMRVLAVAMRPLETAQNELQFADIEGGLTLLGLAGLKDPPRPEAQQAVQACLAAGIQVKMITGDHPDTATAIGMELGIVGASPALAGSELDQLDDMALARRVKTTAIFARMSPEHKLRLVRALQADGMTVAMTGDGVNDAPALAAADIGIAMGQQGTAVAREASKMVLADDNFATIVRAVEVGRTVYANLIKSIRFALPTNGGQGLVVIVGLFAGGMMPITPLQILWVNLAISVFLGLVFAFEPGERHLMQCPPRPRQSHIIDKQMVWQITLVSVLLMLITFAAFEWSLARYGSIEIARGAALNALVLGQIAYLFNMRFSGSSFNRRLFSGNRLLWPAISLLLLAQAGLLYWQPVAIVFGVAGPPLQAWLFGIAGAGILFLLMEGQKRLFSRAR